MSRTKVALLVTIFVLLGIIVLGVWQWNEYKNSPQYSLARLLLATNEGDWAAVQLYIDTDAITEDVADGIIEREVDTGGPFSGLVKRLAEAAKPAVAEQVESQLQQSVEARRGRNGLREYFGAFITTRSAKRTTLEEGQERVSVSVTFRGRTYDLVLRMQRAGPVWRVIAVENLPSVLGEK